VLTLRFRQLADLQQQVRQLEADRDALQMSIRPGSIREPSEHRISSPSVEARAVPDRQQGSNFVFGNTPHGYPSSQDLQHAQQILDVSHGGSNGPVEGITSPSHSITSMRGITVNARGRSNTTFDAEQPSPRYEAISTTYPKPHDRPLPSNDQVLLHLPSDLGVASFFDHSHTQRDPRTTRIDHLVKIDRSVVPSAQHINSLLHHFEHDISAAFPIFHLPTLKSWVDTVCFKGEPVESEVACAVLCKLKSVSGEPLMR
jgi:hypothetical protein